VRMPQLPVSCHVRVRPHGLHSPLTVGLVSTEHKLLNQMQRPVSSHTELAPPDRCSMPSLLVLLWKQCHISLRCV
jgi:hypothetical protein